MKTIAERSIELNRMPLRELKEIFAKHYAYLPNGGRRFALIRKILWAEQCSVHGDISSDARKRASDIADERFLRARLKKSIDSSGGALTRSIGRELNRGSEVPLAGTVLTRIYQGNEIRVTVLEKGFEYHGKSYRSLSAIAREVTGTQWNGKVFFGLKKGSKK